VSRGELPSKDGTLKKGGETRKVAPDSPTGAGGAGPAAPPRKRERWLLLFTSG